MIALNIYYSKRIKKTFTNRKNRFDSLNILRLTKNMPKKNLYAHLCTLYTRGGGGQTVAQLCVYAYIY